MGRGRGGAWARAACGLGALAAAVGGARGLITKDQYLQAEATAFNHETVEVRARAAPPPPRTLAQALLQPDGAPPLRPPPACCGTSPSRIPAGLSGPAGACRPGATRPARPRPRARVLRSPRALRALRARAPRRARAGLGRDDVAAICPLLQGTDGLGSRAKVSGSWLRAETCRACGRCTAEAPTVRAAGRREGRVWSGGADRLGEVA